MSKNKSWGGDWTKEKLDTFEKYVEAYLTIMHSTRKKCDGWPYEIIYFDGFAGSGTTQSYENKSDDYYEKLTLFGIEISKEEENVYKGSPEIVLRMNKKFDKYYFIDNDKNSIESLKNKLNVDGLVTKDCFFIHGDANQELIKLANQLDNKKVALVLLDPFGMQINWASIKSLKGKKVDLWLLLPSGVIINRLLDKNGELNHSEKLEKFFGLPRGDIKNIFYKTQRNATLFGESESVLKVDNSIEEIRKIYCKQLKNIFSRVTEKPLILYNSKNVAIYHFIFASNNEAALKIASQIIKKKKS